MAADSLVKCKKCSNHYDDARMLPCLHSFCKNCVGQLVIQTGSKKTVRCPTCSNSTPLPLKGVEVFPRNVRLSYEATITKYKAQIKSETPPSCDECRREPPLETVSFCCTCRSFLCIECHDVHIRSQKVTKNHTVFLLEDTRQRNVQVMLKEHIPPPPIACIQHPKKHVEFFCTRCNELICTQCALIQHSGHGFEELTNLSEKKKDIIKENVQSMPTSIAKLEETLVKGMEMKEELKASKEAVDDRIRRAFNEMREELDKREKVLLAKSEEISTAKDASLTNQLKRLTSLKDEMLACTAFEADVQESYSDIEVLSVVTTLQTRVQELTQQFSKTSLKLKENGMLTLFIDTSALKSEIAMFGTIRKYQSRDYTSLKEPLISIHSNTPVHVAVHDNGDIFVTDHYGHHVQVYDKKGSKKTVLGSSETFSYPTGIAIAEDTMFVSDFTGKRIQKLTTGGQVLSKFSSSEKFSGHHGCAVSLDGRIHVAVQENNCIHVQILDPAGTHSHTIGQGQLKKPRAVAIDRAGNIHVASVDVKAIKVYTPTGELVREYGGEQLKGPSGVAVDEDGYCLVGDQKAKSLCIFDPQGRLVHSIKFPGEVCGVTLDKDGFVYVVDRGSNKVHKY